MHLIETYALNCGAKIGKPYIYDSYIPLPDEQFVSLHTDCKFPAKNYNYWQEVIDLIHPILEKEKIKIVQVGGQKDIKVNKAIDYTGKTTINQLAYLIKHSSLHFGSDSLPIHLASVFDVPIVGLYSIIQPENAGPYFGNKEKQVIFKCYERANRKPFYSADENPKCVNLVNPEEIAEAILKLLNIKSKNRYETVHMGERYGKVMLHDFIPDQVVNIPNKDSVLDVRMDYFFSQEALAQQLQVNKCRVFTDKKISLEILKTFKTSIESLFYIINENDDPSFVIDVASLGIKVVLLSELSEEEINKKKINYYEHGNIIKLPVANNELVEKLRQNKNLYYKSCRNIYSSQKIYSSLAAQKNNLAKNNDFEPVIDCPEFWQEAQNFFLVKMLDN